MAGFTVLVVDDFERLRDAICQLLEDTQDLCVIGMASDGLEAVKQARQLQPDLVLLDVGLPKVNGIEAAREIRKASPASKLLFLSQESSTAVIAEAFRIGAHGYVLKSEMLNELLDAVDAVLHNKEYVSRCLNYRQRSA
jgi:DNA-binding NarL/FixJ family response regulator